MVANSHTRLVQWSRAGGLHPPDGSSILSASTSAGIVCTAEGSGLVSEPYEAATPIPHSIRNSVIGKTRQALNLKILGSSPSSGS